MLHRRLALGLTALALGCAAASAGAAVTTIATDRAWQRLPDPAVVGQRATLRAAARRLDDRSIHCAGVRIDGERLARLAATPVQQPLVRAVREDLGRAVDVPDFLYWLDDLARAGLLGSARTAVWLPSGRARNAGVLLHPDDIFGNQPRRYGHAGRRLAITRPQRPAELQPAADGDPLGARWTARYRNPVDEDARLRALAASGHANFAARLRDLLDQFRAQGAEAWLFSTVRSRERGYLIYGSFILSRAQDAGTVRRRVHQLRRLNRQWQLDVPIKWQAPGDWRATVAAARRMASAYNVVYATRRGARHSQHYRGEAADFAVVDLPRRVTLTAPDDDSRKTFDLSAPDESRDLDLTPRLIRWVERHFDLHKLKSDYPHWSDTRTR